MGPLSGQLIHYFLIAVLDAIFLSWLAIAWYRRRMLALMSASSLAGGEARSVSLDHGRPSAPHPAVPPSDFRVVLVNADVGPGGRNLSPTDTGDRRVRLRLAAAYATGAALYSAVITGLRLGPEAATFPLVWWFAEWWTTMWPVVPTLAVLLALDRREGAKAAVTYLGIGCLAVVIFTLAGQVLRGSFDSAPITNVYWMLVSLAFLASAPLALILVTAWRPIRGVAPMVMAATLMFGAGMFAFRQALVRALNFEGVQSALTGVGTVTSLQLAQYALFMLASLPVGWVAWLALERVAARFAQKRFSDMQLIVGSWWVIVAAEAAATLPGPGLWALAGGIAALGAYKAGVRGVLSAWPLEVNTDAPRLLLLRVFGYQARTERLFDRVAAVWRFRGPVHLIAAPDLATRTVDPGDTLALIGGRLAKQYVGSVSEIPHRMATLDRRPDPDGRFRVNEVYCHDDTWRPSLEALLDASDGVLMDLRSFSRQNAGCIFELEQIVRRVPSDHVVFVCDRTTDVPFLESVAGAAWAAASADGRARGDGSIATLVIEGHSREELARLWACLDRIGGDRVTVRPDISVAAAVSP
jgi:hypothetical protein